MDVKEKIKITMALDLEEKESVGPNSFNYVCIVPSFDPKKRALLEWVKHYGPSMKNRPQSYLIDTYNPWFMLSELSIGAIRQGQNDGYLDFDYDCFEFEAIDWTNKNWLKAFYDAVKEVKNDTKTNKKRIKKPVRSIHV